MAGVKDCLNELIAIDGALGAAGGGLDLELAGAGNSQVVKAKMETMKSLGIKGEIEDMLITLEAQLHIIRPTHLHDGLFIYLVLDKSKANLALARRKVQSIEEQLEV